ncbi:MAG: zinc-binding dehydrogenase [Pseudomonadota bacterium]
MRAVLMERGKLWVEEIPTPQPGPGQVLVKSRACGICGSDLHAAQHTETFVQTSIEAGGAFKLTTFNPVVLGHEFCAEIVDYGPSTTAAFAPGNLVCSVPMLMAAQHGHTTAQPPRAVGYDDQAHGGFAQYMLLSETLLRPVPNGLDPTFAALTEPMAVGLHAVNKAELKGQETIVVVGCGPVGLAVLTALAERRARFNETFGPIIAADYSPARREMAVRQGADVVIDPKLTHPLELPQATSKNMVIFECVGVPGLLDDLFLKAPANTQIVVVGVCLQTDHIRPLIAINKELKLQFVLGYSLQEFSDSLQLIGEGRFDVAELVSHRISLDEVASTFEDLKAPDTHGKVIVEPWR